MCVLLETQQIGPRSPGQNKTTRIETSHNYWTNGSRVIEWWKQRNEVKIRTNTKIQKQRNGTHSREIETDRERQWFYDLQVNTIPRKASSKNVRSFLNAINNKDLLNK